MTTLSDSQINHSPSIQHLGTVDTIQVQEQILRSKMSNRTPVFRLHIETLPEIFMIIKEEADAYEEAGDWFWLSITHVCKSWRKIAMGTQGLWTYIDTGVQANTDQTKAYLDRSGTSKLNVFHGVGMDELALQCLFLALEHIRRIRELRVLALDDIPAQLQKALLNPAPELHWFALHAGPYSEEEIDPKSLFSGQAPKLKNLSLHIYTPSWAEASIARNLKRLSIGSCSGPVILEDAYSLLVGNPDIEHFKIVFQPEFQSMLYTHHDNVYLHPSPIQLSALNDLSVINVNFEVLSHMLKSIIIPNSIGWCINCTDFFIKETPRGDPRAIVPNISSGNETCEFLLLKIHPAYVEFDSSHGSLQKEHDDEIELKRSLCYTWGDQSDGDERSGVTLIEGFHVICSVLADSFWCSTKSLSVDIETYFPRQFHNLLGYRLWRQLLNCVPELRDLTVRHVQDLEVSLPRCIFMESYTDLLIALASFHESKNSFVCPQLSLLHLCGINLTKKLEDFVYFLEYRSSRSSLLHRLELCEPTMDDWTLDYLKKLGIAEEIEIITGVHVQEESDSESDYDGHQYNFGDGL